MSGQRIDDHGLWIGKAPSHKPFPDGAKMKQVSDKEGAGSLMHYEDTEEAIGHVQSQGVGKLKSRPLKTGYRN